MHIRTATRIAVACLGLQLFACRAGGYGGGADRPDALASVIARALVMESTVREVNDGSVRTLRELASKDGLAIVVIDQATCMSCLAVDVELRALRAREPALPVVVMTTEANAKAVSAYFSGLRLRHGVYVATAPAGSPTAHAIEGSLSFLLVAADGRVLFSQVRVPGSRETLLTEDLAALRRLLGATAGTRSLAD